MVSKDGEDCLWGIAGLKFGKERMRDEVNLGLTLVSHHSSIENGRKVGTQGGCGGPGGDSGSGNTSAGSAGPGSRDGPDGGPIVGVSFSFGSWSTGHAG